MKSKSCIIDWLGNESMEYEPNEIGSDTVQGPGAEMIEEWCKEKGIELTGNIYHYRG